MTGARIHPTAIVDPACEIADDVEIGPYCVVGPDVVLDQGVRLIAHVYVERLTRIGAGTVVYPFVALGAPGQDTSYKGEPTRLEIGARNVIREQASMHRGTVRGRGVTRVGDGCLFMAQSHVGHDCIVGDGVIVAQGATLGGHVSVADGANLGGLCAIHQRVRVGRGAFIGGLAAVMGDVIPFGVAIGNHARLAGLNMVGLKRRGLSRAELHALRAVYRALFEGEGVLAERVAAAAQAFADQPPAMEIIDFVRDDAARDLCLPALR